jgi:hypothetical protein
LLLIAGEDKIYMMSGKRKPIPLYTSSGDTAGFLDYPYLYNANGDWIGWVNEEKRVFSVYGQYVGWLSNDRRILRRRADGHQIPSLDPPPAPPRLAPPVLVPLPPLMAELKYETVDVLDEMPDMLPTHDAFAIEDEA